MPDRTLPPPAGTISKFDMIRARTSRLGSGVPVHGVAAGTHDIILIEFIFRSGKWYENKSGVSFFASKMLMEGSESMTSAQIASFFESHGARIEVHAGSDLVIFSVYVLKKHFTTVIKVLKDLFLRPVYPVEELDIMKEIQIQHIRVNDRKNNIRAGKEFRKILFGPEHPYGRSLEVGDIENHINRENLLEYYRQKLLAGMEIVISGNLTPELTGEMELFSDIPFTGISESKNNHSFSAEPERRISVEGSSQTSIRYGRKIIPKDHEDYASLVVLNEIMGGFFGSRLMKNIREDKGYTYGIHSSLVHLIHDSYWIIGTDVKKEFAEDTMSEILNEFRKLREEPVGAEELEMVRNYLMGNFLSSMETSFSLADKFKNIYFFNLGYEYYDHYLESLHSISAARIQEMANKYLDEEVCRLVMVG